VSPMCHPEAQAEGSLGTGVPWEDKKKNVPREDIPKRRLERSEMPRYLAGQKMGAWQERWRVRGALLLLGRTKNGGSVGQKMGAWRDKKRGLGAKIVKNLKSEYNV